MSEHLVERNDIVDAIRGALEPREYVLAMWEGGAAAFGRVDRWSDIDLQVLCEDGHVDEIYGEALEALERLSPVDLRFRMPEPNWHGHSQVLWRLRDASPFLLLDFVVMESGNDRDRFLQPEIHGRAKVHFDKTGALDAAPFDAKAHAALLRDRMARHRVLCEMSWPFVRKEIERGNPIEAIAYYQSMVLRPLVELLRIKHSPLRYNFHTRYVYYEFPRGVVERLERLFYVSDLAELGTKCDEADEWTGKLLQELGDGPTESTISDVAAREAR